MSDSIWDDPTITAYVLGELSDDQRDEFESRMESNSELAAVVEEVRGVTGQLEELYAAEPTVTLDTERRDSILAGETEASLRTGDSHSWRIPILILATAAAILLLVGIGPWLNQRQLEIAVSQLEDTTDEKLALDATVVTTEAEATLEQAAESPTRELIEQTVTSAIESLPTSLGRTSGESSESLRPSAALDVSGPVRVPQLAQSQLAQSQLAQSQLAQSQLAQSQPAELERLDAGAIANKSASVSNLSLSAEGRSSASPARIEQDALSTTDADTVRSEDLSELIAGTKVEAVAELGTIVLRGSKRDVASVKEAIDQVELGKQLERAPLEGAESNFSRAVQPTAPRAADQSRLKYRADSVQAAPSAQPHEVAENESKKKVETMFLKQSDGPVGDDELLEAGEGLLDRVRAERTASEGRLKAEVRAQLREAPVRLAKEAEVTRRYAVPQPVGAAAGRGGIAGGAERQLGLQSADYFAPIDEGRGPGIAGDRFDPITDNPFKRVSEHPLSTFSVDVDTASYSKTRDFLMRAGSLPRPDAVRIEEMLNYFDYEYDPPSSGEEHPFAARATVTACPWNKKHRLARIALKGKTMDKDERPPCNLVFLLDTSGSMNAPNKLPLVIEGMKMLVDQLNEQDRVAITVYAGSAGLVLDSVPAKKSKKIRKALTQLSAGGSTNGGAGIALAYHTARENFITEGVNRVILCTDGDFNVGTTGTDELVRMVEQEAKGNIFLSVLGFGMGNHNDAMLEKISGRGNGNYAFIDTESEAHKVLVNQTSGTLVTIAKDVKLQIEFNPTHVSSYRLIGYENRVLAKEDFNDDKKDAGEIGAGHAVTALYEIVPADVQAGASAPEVDDLKYQSKLQETEAADSDEMMTLKLRYKQPDGDVSTLVEFPVTDDGSKFDKANHDLRFAAAVAGFGMQLRRSEYAGSWTLSDVLKVAEDAKGEDEYGFRAEFVELVRKASELMGQQ